MALSALAQWADEWQLSVAVNKCGVLCIGKCITPVAFQINNVSLPMATSYRDLGITVACDLTPELHIRDIVNNKYVLWNMVSAPKPSSQVHVCTVHIVTEYHILYSVDVVMYIYCLKILSEY